MLPCASPHPQPNLIPFCSWLKGKLNEPSHFKSNQAKRKQDRAKDKGKNKTPSLATDHSSETRAIYNSTQDPACDLVLGCVTIQYPGLVLGLFLSSKPGFISFNRELEYEWYCLSLGPINGNLSFNCICKCLNPITPMLSIDPSASAPNAVFHPLSYIGNCLAMTNILGSGDRQYCLVASSSNMIRLRPAGQAARLHSG